MMAREFFAKIEECLRTGSSALDVRLLGGSHKHLSIRYESKIITCAEEILMLDALLPGGGCVYAQYDSADCDSISFDVAETLDETAMPVRDVYSGQGAIVIELSSYSS